MSYLITLYVHETLDFFQSSAKLNYIPARFMRTFQEKAHCFFFLCISVPLNQSLKAGTPQLQATNLKI